MPLTPAPTRAMEEVVVQTAAAWPSSPAGWTTQATLKALKGREGFTNDLGELSLMRYSGKLFVPGTTSFVERTALSILGHYVRISIADIPLWWGVVRSQTRQPSGDLGQLVTYSCANLGYVLDQITPRYGYGETASSPSKAIDWPIFNARKGGDKSLNTYVVGDQTVSVHGSNPTIGALTEWTALDVATLILGMVKDQCPGGPTWTITGQTDALVAVEKWNLSGTALEMLTRLINPRHGLGFNITVDEGASPPEALITVMSGLATEIDVEGATIPAAEDPLALDFTGDAVEDRWIVDWSITETCDATYDFIGVEGSPPWWCLTLGFKNDGTGQLIKGWTTDQEDDWDDATDEERNQGALAHVWRRFVLRDDWTGETYLAPTESKWLFDREISGSGDEQYGEEGETGEMSDDATLLAPDPGHYRFTRCLPLYQSQTFEWDEAIVTAGAVTGIDRTKPLKQPLVFAVDGDDWMELGKYWGDEDVSLQPEDDAAAVILGSGAADAERIRVLCEDDELDLAFTVGIHHPSPLRVSWRRVPASRPRDQDRQIVIPVKAERWILADDTVVRAVDLERGLLNETVTVLDEIKILRQTLALARSWYGSVDIDLTWTDRGYIDFADAQRPGRLVNSITLRTGIASPTTITHGIYSVITSRTWDFTEQGYGTTYQTKRIVADISAVR